MKALWAVALAACAGCVVWLVRGREGLSVDSGTAFLMSTSAGGGVLSEHERALFRQYQVLHHQTRGVRARHERHRTMDLVAGGSPDVALGGTGGGPPGEGLNCDGCQGMGGLSLPLYDNDAGEFLGAMQRQDILLLDQQKEQEDREKAIKEGQKVPALLPVTCDSECFATKGVWCCRRKKKY